MRAGVLRWATTWRAGPERGVRALGGRCEALRRRYVGPGTSTAQGTAAAYAPWRGGPAEHAAAGGQGHRGPALPGRAEPHGAAQDRLEALALRLHQLRQVRARLPQRRELRLRDGPCTGPSTRTTRVRAGAVVAVAGGRVRGEEGAPDRELPGLLQRVRQLRHLLPRGRRALHREAALLRVAGRLARASARDGFFCLRQADVDAAWARIRGVRVPPGGGPRARPRALHGRRHPRGGAPQRAPARCRPARAAGTAEGHVLDFAAYLNMALAVDGVLDARRANPVNARVAGRMTTPAAVTYDDVAAAARAAARRRPTARRWRPRARSTRRLGARVLPEVREPAAHGRLQVPRRLQRDLPAERAGARAGRAGLLLRQPRAGDGAGLPAAGRRRPRW